MGASSKKKGQQRKAAAKRAQSAETVTACGANVGSSISGGSGGINAKTLAKIRSGDNKATKRFHDGLNESIMGSTPLVSLEDSGILHIILDYLKRCEDYTFEEVMASVGGNLVTPISWMCILSKGSYVEQQSCRLHIAESIGPVVKCMINDTDRLFFKGKRYWKEGIVPFSLLVTDLLCSSINRTDETVMSALLNHEGLINSIIQWAFWNEEHRPDLVKELGAKDCAEIVSLGRQVLTMIGGVNIFRSWFVDFGTTPIVNKSYDPSCKLSLVEGLILIVKKEGWESDGTKATSAILCRLIEEADCIDKGVVTELIKLGTNFTTDISSAELVTRLASRMICSEVSEDETQPNEIEYEVLEEKFQPNDTRTAFAIRAGLIEMCFDFIERFYRHSSITIDDGLFYFIEHIFRDIYDLSLHQKTAKAIKSKKIIIEEKLVFLKQNTDITNYTDTECKDLLDMVKSILSLSGESYCCRCNKSLSKTEVMQCNGCSCMVYCSKACQKEDWLNGHKLTCCCKPNNSNLGSYQGRFWPPVSSDDERDVTKLKDLDINMNMIHLKMFLDNAEDILRQAKKLELLLCDCVVVICPTKVEVKAEVKKYTDVYDKNPDVQKKFEESRSKENITCHYYSNIYIGQQKGYVVGTQRLFPHEWLTKQSK